ncbi:MAG: hypothetical protein OXI12_07875 [Gammaproteobacteria bacterium]|nr:hypothetical protein [Gammaproteobacteria bacterium]
MLADFAFLCTEIEFESGEHPRAAGIGIDRLETAGLPVAATFGIVCKTSPLGPVFEDPLLRFTVLDPDEQSRDLLPSRFHWQKSAFRPGESVVGFLAFFDDVSFNALGPHTIKAWARDRAGDDALPDAEVASFTFAIVPQPT